MDKNGRLITRHIKYDESVMPKKSMPTVFSMFREDERFPGKTKETLEYPLRMHSSAERKKITKTLNDDTMRALYSMGIGADSNYESALESDTRAVASQCFSEGSYALLNNIAFFAQDGDRGKDAMTLRAFFPLVKGLSQYQEPGTPRIDYTHATDEELDQARKMLTIAETFQHEGGVCIAQNYDAPSGGGPGVYMNAPAAVEAMRSMSTDEALEFVKLARQRDVWLDEPDQVASHLDWMQLRDETHDALDDGVL